MLVNPILHVAHFFCAKCWNGIPVPLDCSAVKVELGLSVVGRTVVTGAGMVGSTLMMAQGGLK